MQSMWYAPFQGTALDGWVVALLVHMHVKVLSRVDIVTAAPSAFLILSSCTPLRLNFGQLAAGTQHVFVAFPIYMQAHTLCPLPAAWLAIES